MGRLEIWGILGMQFSVLGVSRRVAAPAVVLCVLTCLTACDVFFENQADGPLAISTDGGQFRAVVCVDSQPTRIYMEERPAGGGWSDLWRLDSPLKLEAGDDIFTVASDQGVPGATPELGPGDLISIQLIGDSASTASLPQAQIRIPAAGMPSTGWLHPDHTVTESACGS